MQINKLKSGTDIRGIALGENIELNDDIAIKIGYAYVKFIESKYPNNKKLRIAVGRDSRLSGEHLQNAICKGIAHANAEAINFSMASTPAMHHCLESNKGYDASIMVTASHHPYNRNGFKFFSKAGGIKSDELNEVINIANSLNKFEEVANGSISYYNYIDDYKKYLANIFNDKNALSGLKIIVDAGNGAGGFFADILKSLGADVSKSQFLEPDGYFPNHIPNPENAEAINSLKEAVIKHKADLGVIFDADCDRCGIVDKNGNEINKNKLIALVSAILLEDNKEAWIVSDSVASINLSNFIKNLGGKHLRFKRGYRNVIDKSVELNKDGYFSPVAMETSGHCAFKENNYIDDGMYLAIKVIKLLADNKENKNILNDKLKAYKDAACELEIRLNILSKDFKTKAKELLDSIEIKAQRNNFYIAEDNYEGLRIYFDKDDLDKVSWIMFRASVHDPVIVVNMESNCKDNFEKLKNLAKELCKDVSEIEEIK